MPKAGAPTPAYWSVVWMHWLVKCGTILPKESCHLDRVGTTVGVVRYVAIVRFGHHGEQELRTHVPRMPPENCTLLPRMSTVHVV